MRTLKVGEFIDWFQKVRESGRSLILIQKVLVESEKNSWGKYDSQK